jgi:hypothetical protein
MAKTIMDFMLEGNKNPHAGAILDLDINDIRYYYDTGNYMLNLAHSCDIFGGIASGKTYEYSGDSQTGKSYLTTNMLLNALKNPKIFVILFESEGATIKSKLEKHLTPEMNARFECQKVTFHEKLGTFMAHQIERIKAAKKSKEFGDYQFIVCLDSLGMLSPEQQYKNILAGKDTKVMNEPQLIKAMFNMIQIPFAEYDVPFLYTNHIYENYMQGFGHIAEIDKKKTRGGQGVEYSPDVKLRLMRKKLYDLEGHEINEAYIKKSEERGTIYSGAKIMVIPTKTRFSADRISGVELDLRFKIGMDRYSGCFDFLQKNKLMKITPAGSNGRKILIPEITFETNTKEMAKMTKEDFWHRDILLYIDKKYKEYYELETVDSNKVLDTINDNVDINV